MDIGELENLAKKIREDVIEMILKAGSGHIAGSLGTVEIFTALYFSVLKHDPHNPLWEERDRFVLSNGHVCPALYASMAHAGYFPRDWLWKYSQLDSPLQGHPERLRLPGIETTSGPLGCGLAQASGIAYALRLDNIKPRVYCVVSDGEHDEGNLWEAVAFAGKNNLSNLTLIIDRNNIQIDGHTEDVMPLEPLKEKYEAFNWHVLDVDGHNIGGVVDACNHAKAVYENPTAIIAHTIPGKGVGFMEWDPAWHARVPDNSVLTDALRKLRSMEGKIIPGE